MSCFCAASRFAREKVAVTKYVSLDMRKIWYAYVPFLRKALWTSSKPIPGPEAQAGLSHYTAYVLKQIQSQGIASTNSPLKNSMPKDADEQTKEEKTKVTIINDEKDRGKLYLPYIYKYSTIGFTIGKNKVMGSVAIFPGGILSWKVISHHQLTPESLALFPLMDPKLEILILGMGDKVVQVPQIVWEFAKFNHIALEVLDTPNACATYNFLTEEGRRTAAALMPPQNIIQN